MSAPPRMSLELLASTSRDTLAVAITPAPSCGCAIRNLPFSNGSGKHEVDVIPLASDWVLRFPKKPEPYPDELPIGLSEVLVMWYRDQKGIRIRTTLPVVKDGNLVGIHVWFDGAAAPEGGRQ